MSDRDDNNVQYVEVVPYGTKTKDTPLQWIVFGACIFGAVSFLFAHMG